MSTNTTPKPAGSAHPGKDDLQGSIEILNHEIRTLEGRIANRDPQSITKLQTENADLAQKFEALKKVLFAVIVESNQPRNEDEAELRYEVLRQSSLEYFKQTKTDPELWKSIAF